MSSNSISEQLQLPSIKRSFQGNADQTSTTLHVLQWNTLAQGLSNPMGNFIRVKNETVAFETRKWRILEQIVTRQPDLCGLEEVDTYECFLQHQIPKHGYTCFYVPKSKSPCLAFENDVANFKGPDGLLLCYKTEKFDEIQRYHCEEPLIGTEGKQFYAVLELKHKASAVRLIFAVTHLKAKGPFAHIRHKQAEGLVKHLSEKHSAIKHIIITGDFNGEPTEPFYNLIREVGFSSAYRTLSNDQEPLFTTWKFREHGGVEQEQCRCIDYIFYKPDAFLPIALLKLPTKEEIGKNGLPSDQYPSDHLALETVFQIVG